jgi:ribonuclease H2 subunit C
MLAIRSAKSKSEPCVPNVLPCRVNHNGPMKVTKRYWQPEKTEGKRMVFTVSVIAVDGV